MTGEISYSWLNPVDTGTGRLLPKRATRRASAKLAGDLPGNWQVSATVKAVGPSWDDPENTREVPGYTVVGLQAARAVSPELTWKVRVENALNVAYEEVYGYPMPGASVSAVRFSASPGGKSWRGPIRLIAEADLVEPENKILSQAGDPLPGRRRQSLGRLAVADCACTAKAREAVP